MEVRRILGTWWPGFLWFFSTPRSYAAPAPIAECIAPAPAVSKISQAPVVGYIAPAPAASHVAPGPIVRYVAPALAVYAALAPIVEYIAPGPAVPTLISPPPGKKSLAAVLAFEAGSKNGCAQVAVYQKVSLKAYAVEALADTTQVLGSETGAAEGHTCYCSNASERGERGIQRLSTRVHRCARRSSSVHFHARVSTLAFTVVSRFASCEPRSQP